MWKAEIFSSFDESEKKVEEHPTEQDAVKAIQRYMQLPFIWIGPYCFPIIAVMGKVTEIKPKKKPKKKKK